MTYGAHYNIPRIKRLFFLRLTPSTSKDCHDFATSIPDFRRACRADIYLDTSSQAWDYTKPFTKHWDSLSPIMSGRNHFTAQHRKKALAVTLFSLVSIRMTITELLLINDVPSEIEPYLFLFQTKSADIKKVLLAAMGVGVHGPLSKYGWRSCCNYHLWWIDLCAVAIIQDQTDGHVCRRTLIYPRGSLASPQACYTDLYHNWNLTHRLHNLDFNVADWEHPSLPCHIQIADYDPIYSVFLVF